MFDILPFFHLNSYELSTIGAAVLLKSIFINFISESEYINK